MSLRNDLIRLAHVDPEIREAVMPMLSKQAFDTDQERLLDAIVLAAENEGRFYDKRDAKGAVDAAWKTHRKATIEDFDHDFNAIKKEAIKQVRKSWGRKPKKATLHSKLVRLAHAQPELRDVLMPLLVAPTLTFGKAAAEQRPRPYADEDSVVERLHAELYKLAEQHRLGNGRAPDGTGALEYQIRFLRASSHRSLPWIYDHIIHTANSAMAQSPVLEPVAKKVIKEAEARAKEWAERDLARRTKRTHA